MRKTRSKKYGKLVGSNVILERHEIKTVLFLLTQGFDIELIPPSYTPLSKTADIFMLGKYWEIKSPIGKTQRTLEHLIKKAAHQSNNIIIDLNRTSIPSKVAIKFTHSTSITAWLRQVASTAPSVYPSVALVLYEI